MGNKCDLDEKRKVSYEQGKEFADQYNMKFMETSAKTAQGVADAFISMTKEVIAASADKEKALGGPKPNVVLKPESGQNLNSNTKG